MKRGTTQGALGRARAAGGTPQNIRGLCKKGTSLEFPLLHVRINFTSGVYMKNISTWTLFMDHQPYCGLFLKNSGAFSARWTETGAEPWKGHEASNSVVEAESSGF